MNEKGQRISFSIKMPSLELKNFIEKALQDDTFFENAIENPIGILKENGIRLNLKLFTPKDLATFYGALSGAKELIKKKDIKDIKFESVFGKAAVVRGSILVAETFKGMWTLFDKDALTETSMVSSVNVNFNKLQETLRESFARINMDSRIEILTSGNTSENVFRVINSATDRSSLENIHLEQRVSFAGATEQRQGTDTGVTFHFDADKGIGSKTSSSYDTYTSKNFGNIVDPLQERSLVEDLFMGPLISPKDLADIAAQINTYVNIADQL